MDADAVAMRTEVLRSHIRDIPDFPQPGVVFKDITPLLGDSHGFRATIDGLAEPYEQASVTKVLGIEARGFIAAAPVADRLGAGFIPVRKPGKLPWEVEKQEYVLEYGTDLLEIHRDALQPGDRVLVVDDVMATGGTAAAAVRLVERLGGHVVGLSFIIELAFLAGRRKIGELPIVSLIVYQ
jgi:adenine phosphoribosyltransferase